MLLLQGLPISPGYADGIATVYDYEIERRLELPRSAISHAEVEEECKRVDDALEQSRQDLKLVEQTALSEPRLVDAAALLSAHSAMANDIAALVDRFRDDVKGVVLWDPAVPATSNVASTVAGVENLLPICRDEASDSLYTRLVAGEPELPVILDVSGEASQQRVIAVLDTLAGLGIRQVYLIDR